MTDARSHVDAGTVDLSTVGGVLFDLDGVLTPTARVHEQAWGEMFDEFLATRDALVHPLGGKIPLVHPWRDEEYFAHVDGKPRLDGVRDFLASRNIELPESSEGDEPSVELLGERKNAAFNAVLERDGVQPYPGSLTLLDELTGLGIPMAVVSSSRNAPAVLDAAGITSRFATVVSGQTAADLGIPGKPAPDMFELAADRLGLIHSDCVVVEDAVSGVRAGAAGMFRAVIGVDRGVGAQVLLDAGADVVVSDLAELVPGTVGGDR